jgi:hypothetical protein
LFLKILKRTSRDDKFNRRQQQSRGSMWDDQHEQIGSVYPWEQVETSSIHISKTLISRPLNVSCLNWIFWTTCVFKYEWTEQRKCYVNAIDFLNVLYLSPLYSDNPIYLHNQWCLDVQPRNILVFLGLLYLLLLDTLHYTNLLSCYYVYQIFETAWNSFKRIRIIQSY